MVLLANTTIRGYDKIRKICNILEDDMGDL